MRRISQHLVVGVVCVVVATLAGCDLGHHDVEDGGTITTGPSIGCSGACHGEGDQIAPPRDTSGRSDLASIGVGAHQAHLKASDWHKRLACETCHLVPKEVGDLGHILVLGANGTPVKDPLPAEAVFTGLGTATQWDHDTATCTNSYCHGDTLHQTDPTTHQVIPGAGGTITQPMWTQVDGQQSKCGACHGTPPPAPHPQNPDCGQCHQSMNPGDFAAGKISYPELHIDGLVEVNSTQPCDSCHGASGQSAPPKDAHGNVATSSPGVGAHAQHMTSSSAWHAPIACNECHLVPGSTTDQTHIDQVDEVYLDPTIVVPGSTTGTGGHLQIPGAVWDLNGLTCSNTYCHGGGNSPIHGGAAITPKWTQVDGMQSQCQSCHGMPPPPPHPVDSNCGTCHPTMTAGNNTTITYPAKHIDGNVDVINDQPCDSCHGAGGNSAPPLDTTHGTTTDLRGVGAHRNHLDQSTWHKQVTCDACHKVPASVEAIGHIDSPLPAEGIFGNIAGSTATLNGTTCSNNYCHGATLTEGGGPAGGTATKPVWTVVNGSQSQCGSCHGLPPPAPHPVDSDCGKCHNTMTAGGGMVITDPSRHIDGNVDVNTDQPCNACHGSTTSNAPPKDTLGNAATTTRGVGAHQSHLNPTTLNFKAIACTDYHLVPATVSSVGHIDTPLPAEVIFSGRAGTSPTWNGAQCANNYCHGATLTDGSTGAGGTATSPIWNKVDGSQQQCSSCHGYPPPTPHPQNSDCGQCHADVKVGANTTFLDASKHIDGNLDVTTTQTCNSCHGNSAGTPASNGDPVNAPPKDTTGGSAPTLRGVGAHAQHLVASSTWHAPLTCNLCHLVPATVGSVGHIDTPLPAEVIPSGIAVGTTWTGSNCSSYCHGATLTGAGGTATSPNWTKVDGTQSQCTSCHGNPPPAPHPTGGTVSNCGACHPDVVNNSPTAFTNVAQHINGTVDVTAGTQHPTGYEMVTMHGYDFDKLGPSTCATAACHGVALTGGSTGGPSCATATGCHDKVAPGFSWQTQCTFCHGDINTPTGNGMPPQGVLGATAASDKSVGAHAIHVNATATHAAWDCTFCHTKPTSALTPGHVDGTGGVVQAEVVYSTLNPSATFAAATAVCSNLYCHGNGQTSAGTATWTTTTALTCTSCHSTTAATGMSGQHSKHIKSEGMKCSQCHSTVVDTNMAIISAALHVDGKKQVTFSGGGTYTAASKSCSGLGGNCHGTKTW